MSAGGGGGVSQGHYDPYRGFPSYQDGYTYDNAGYWPADSSLETFVRVVVIATYYTPVHLPIGSDHRHDRLYRR